MPATEARSKLLATVIAPSGASRRCYASAPRAVIVVSGSGSGAVRPALSARSDDDRRLPAALVAVGRCPVSDAGNTSGA
jgi:hypothetical protein